MIEYRGIRWYRYQGALLPRVPPHHNVMLTQEEQRELLRRSGAYFLRYTDAWDRESGNFWYIIKDSREDLQSYKSKVRNQIKKGLKNCRVERVSREWIAEKGYGVYRKAFSRYATYHRPTDEKAFFAAIMDSDDEFWAVFNKENRLIAYANNFIEEDVCHYNSMKFDPDYLKLYPSYALIHEMNNYYLNEKKVLYVNDGARSIAHDTAIQKLLVDKFGFRKAFCRLNIAYRRDLAIVLKLLYPWRRLFERFSSKRIQQLMILLKQEEIRRSFEQ